MFSLAMMEAIQTQPEDVPHPTLSRNPSGSILIPRGTLMSVLLSVSLDKSEYPVGPVGNDEDSAVSAQQDFIAWFVPGSTGMYCALVLCCSVIVCWSVILLCCYYYHSDNSTELIIVTRMNLGPDMPRLVVFCTFVTLVCHALYSHLLGGHLIQSFLFWALVLWPLCAL